jgi:putative aldouronate transport system permease protein
MATEQTVGINPSIGASTPDNLTEQKRLGKRRKSKGAMARDLAFYVMLLPGVIVLLVNNYLPMIGVIIPFEDYRFQDNFFSSLVTSKFTGFQNFVFLFTTSDALNAMKNTILYNIVFISLDVIVPVALAIAMSQMWNKHIGNFYQSAMFLPYFISWVAVSYVVYAFFVSQNGFIDTSILKTFGIDQIDFYSEPKFWPFILTFFHLWKYTGYNLIVYIASLSGISGEYYEAASLDGATKWQQVKYITLPLLKTTMIILALLAVGRIFNGDFDLFFNVPKDTSMLYDVSDVLDTYVYRCLINLNDVGMSAAAGLFQAVVGCVVVLLANVGVRRFDPDSALF